MHNIETSILIDKIEEYWFRNEKVTIHEFLLKELTKEQYECFCDISPNFKKEHIKNIGEIVFESKAWIDRHPMNFLNNETIISQWTKEGLQNALERIPV